MVNGYGLWVTGQNFTSCGNSTKIQNSQKNPPISFSLDIILINVGVNMIKIRRRPDRDHACTIGIFSDLPYQKLLI